MSAPESARDSALPTLILTALGEETSALLDRMRETVRVRDGGRTWRGRLTNQRVWLAETGVGPKNAAAGVVRAMRSAGPVRWIGAGLAGGLAPELAVGQIVIARDVSDEDGTVAPGPDREWSARALARGAGAASARFRSARGIAATAAEKSALRGQAPGRFDALDMESAAWARAAATESAGSPYLLVRVVSDTASEELPGLVAAAIRPDGSLDRGRAARQALRHPGSIGKLLALRRRAGSCAGALAEFLDRFAAAGF